MDQPRAADEIIRLGKLDLSPELRELLEEAARLLAEGSLLEAEALLQNLEARFHFIRKSRGAAEAAGTPDQAQPASGC
jgi:hypothetical protein